MGCREGAHLRRRAADDQPSAEIGGRLLEDDSADSGSSAELSETGPLVGTGPAAGTAVGRGEPTAASPGPCGGLLGGGEVDMRSLFLLRRTAARRGSYSRCRGTSCDFTRVEVGEQPAMNA